MKVLGEELEVEWQHLLIVFAIPLAIGILVTLVSLFYGMLSGASGIFDAFYGYMSGIAPVYSLLASPLLAYLYLHSAKLMKLGGQLSRSLATAEFLVWGLGYAVLAIFAYIYVGMHLASELPAIAYLGLTFMNTLFNAFVASMLTYLWLLLFTNYDSGRLKAAAPKALLYALAAFVAGNSMHYLVSYSMLEVWQADMSITGILFNLASGFLFALPVLYSFRRPGQWAYVFAIAFTFPFFTSILIEMFSTSTVNYALSYSVEFAIRLIQLVLLFLIAGSRDVFKPLAEK